MSKQRVYQLQQHRRREHEMKIPTERNRGKNKWRDWIVKRQTGKKESAKAKSSTRWQVEWFAHGGGGHKGTSSSPAAENLLFSTMTEWQKLTQVLSRSSINPNFRDVLLVKWITEAQGGPSKSRVSNLPLKILVISAWATSVLGPCTVQTPQENLHRNYDMHWKKDTKQIQKKKSKKKNAKTEWRTEK